MNTRITSMIDRMEYAVDEFLMDYDIDYRREDSDIVYFEKCDVRTEKNKVSIRYYPSGYSIKMFPVGPDAMIRKKNKKEIAYFCCLLNGIMEHGMKFYLQNDKIILEKFVDCIENKENKIPAMVKQIFNFADTKEKYEKYLDLILMVNHDIFTAEEAFQEALRK